MQLIQKNLLKNLERIFWRDARLSVQCKFILEERAQAQIAKKKLQLKWKPNIRNSNLLMIYPFSGLTFSGGVSASANYQTSSSS